MTNQENMPRGKEELIAERDRILAAIEAKRIQTEANVAAGIIEAGAPDEDAEALAAELEAIELELSGLRGEEQDRRIEDAKQGELDV